MKEENYKLPFWPDKERLRMVEKSEYYDNPSLYQYGYYDGFQLAIEKYTTQSSDVMDKSEWTDQDRANYYENKIDRLNRLIESKDEELSKPSDAVEFLIWSSDKKISRLTSGSWWNPATNRYDLTEEDVYSIFLKEKGGNG